MKATGIVRRIDQLGRLVLPIELRKTIGINQGEPVEIYVEQDAVILKKYKASCIFCESKDNLIDYMGKCICRECLTKFQHLK